MFNFQVENASGYILKICSCFFYFSCLYFTSFVSIVMFSTTYVAAHSWGGGGTKIHEVLKISNRWQCINFIFTYIEGTLNGVDMSFVTKDVFHNAKSTFDVYIKYNF
jgi:hypothetical protein